MKMMFYLLLLTVALYHVVAFSQRSRIDFDMSEKRPGSGFITWLHERDTLIIEDNLKELCKTTMNYPYQYSFNDQRGNSKVAYATCSKPNVIIKLYRKNSRVQKAEVVLTMNITPHIQPLNPDDFMDYTSNIEVNEIGIDEVRVYHNKPKIRCVLGTSPSDLNYYLTSDEKFLTEKFKKVFGNCIKSALQLSHES